MQLAAHKSHVTLRLLLDLSALLLCLTVLLATIWIVLPAPSYNVWLLSVAASEWSLWFGSLAMLGIACAIAAHAFGMSRWLPPVALLCGVLAILCALLPPLSALRAARKQNVQLSLRDYFSLGESDKQLGDARLFTTHTFAVFDNNRLQLDHYTPPNGIRSNGAAVIVVHGGSWNAGQRSDFPHWNRWLTRHGFAVFDIDYRLQPQPNWETATDDVKAAVAWIKCHAHEFHINPRRLALLGRSAGGHLALLAAYTASNARLPSSCTDLSNAPQGTQQIDASVNAVVSFYAPTDLLWAYDNPANQLVIDGPLTLRRFLGGTPYDNEALRERFSLASPISTIKAQTPPTLLIHGGRDQLVRTENMNRLAHALQQADVPHRTVLIPYAEHGFDYNFNGWGAQIVKPLLLDFLNESLALR